MTALYVFPPVEYVYVQFGVLTCVSESVCELALPFGMFAVLAVPLPPLTVGTIVIVLPVLLAAAMPGNVVPLKKETVPIAVPAPRLLMVQVTVTLVLPPPAMLQPWNVPPEAQLNFRPWNAGGLTFSVKVFVSEPLALVAVTWIG